MDTGCVCECVCVFVSVVSLCVWLLPQEPLTEQSCQETNDLRQTCGPWLRALTGLYLGYMTKKKKKRSPVLLGSSQTGDE